MHRSNPRVPGDLRALLAAGVEMVIAAAIIAELREEYEAARLENSRIDLRERTDG